MDATTFEYLGERSTALRDTGEGRALGESARLRVAIVDKVGKEG